MKDYILDQRTTKEKLRDSQNARKEATQLINPITGVEYLQSLSPKVKRLEDPIQAHLRVMEEREPSLNEHKQGFFKGLGDRLSLVDRAFQYRNGSQHIWKVEKKFKKYKNSDKIIDFNLYNLDEKIIKKNFYDLYNLKEKIK